MAEAADLHIDLLARLTDEQAAQYAHDLTVFGRSAIKQEADGSVRVISPAELNPAYEGDVSDNPVRTKENG